MSAPHDLAPLFTACFQGVLQASWQGSLAIGLVLLARRALGARVPARWHYLLWFLALARLLVPAVVLPHSPASLENLPALAGPFARPPAVLQRKATSVVSEPASSMPPVAAPSFVTGLPPRPVAAAPSGGKAWSPWGWAAWIWLSGVLVLSVRLAAGVLGLRGRLRRETFPAEESVLAVWQVCCQRWLRHRPPHLLVADWVDSPALVGWWRPTLLIPQRSLDAFSAQDWEHVFAHEIAHLRWRDHWSQLLLLAAGCVHWFNPVVWLGLRRLRADRELAADEWALRRLQDGRALAYGETLFKTLAHRPARLAFQPGMVGISEDGAQMKQRLRRIAAFLPQRRLSGSLAGFAVVLALGTVVLGQGSPGPAALPPSKVSGQPSATPAHPSTSTPAAQDHDANREAAKAPAPTDAGRFVNKGRVSMADGTPLGPGPITAHTNYETVGFSGGGAETVENGVFPLDAPYDVPEDTTTLTVGVEQRGCAVVFAGPFTLANLDKAGRLEVKLTRGYGASVQIVDEAGRPIPGAWLQPYHPGPPVVELTKTRTDAAGNATIEHLGAAPLNLRVVADGFQADEAAGVHLDPAKPYRWTLKPATPLHGTITAAATRTPIAGAVIKLAGVSGAYDETHLDPATAPALTTTDAQGRFTLGSLRPGSRYYLFVEASGYGGAYLRGVQLAQGELNVALGPELRLRGKIVHAPASVVHMGKVDLQYGQACEFDDHHSGIAWGSVELQPVNGETEFTVGPFHKVIDEPADPQNVSPRKGAPVELYVESWGHAVLGVDELPVANFVFDLARKSSHRDAAADGGSPKAAPSPVESADH